MKTAKTDNFLFYPKPQVDRDVLLNIPSHSQKVDQWKEILENRLGIEVNKNNLVFADPVNIWGVVNPALLELCTADLHVPGFNIYLKIRDSFSSCVDVSPNDWLDVLLFGAEMHPVMAHQILARNNHQNSAIAAKRSNVNLIQIYDWYNQDIIIDMLKSKLKIQPRKMFARDTKVKQITQTEANKFLAYYHMQGATKKQSYCLGLFDKHSNELLQVQTFGPSRFDKNYEWEAIRLASKFGVTIVGGVSKGFHRFLKDKNPQSVISYVDADRSMGVTDEETGFKFVRSTTPSIYWIDPFGVDKKPYRNTSLQSMGIDKLLDMDPSGFPDYDKQDKSTSNTALMFKNGYARIFTSGSFVYEWRK